MLFNSVEFLIFFALVLPLHFLLPLRVRWVMLLGASLWFYMAWRADYVWLVLATVGLDYFASLWIDRTDDPVRRRAYLIISLTGNLGLLFAFKYFNFFNDSLRAVFHYYNLPYQIPKLDVVLPVGISFYTFQSMSYTIDVYRRRIKPERYLHRFALFVCYFPHMVAGPIMRAEHLLPQLFAPHRLDWQRIRSGVTLVLWGFFKKVVVADRLANYVDPVYNHVQDHTGLQFLLATYFFAFQIYCDFSGYSDIAIGISRMMGIDLIKNFDRPYFSKSIVEFWRRWHIALSTWLRDYLYISLGGNRRGVRRTYINIAITMFLGGVWHGANWTFIVWGTLQGILLIASRIKEPYSKRFYESLNIPPVVRKFIQVGITFHLACLSWVFFRANTLSDAFHILRNVFQVRSWYEWFDIVSPQDLILSFVVLLSLLAGDLLDRRVPIDQYFSSKPRAIRWAFQYAMLFMILLFGIREAHVFIYFAF